MADPKSWSLLLIMLMFGIPNGLQAQESYRSVKGKVQVHGKGEHGSITARSGQLFVRVDHETGNLFMKLEQATLRTGIDSVDRRLDSLSAGPIVFEGRLKRGGFNPNQCYSATPLRIHGTMSYGDMERELAGSGEFKSQFSNGRIPCLLKIGFEVELGKTQHKGFLPGFNENVKIKILQALLNPKM